ncbi:MAG TPA: hypothetical protein VGR32_05005 [Brevundimonas sp.]|uniref:hypothetical protein n=1 Tax=Brevundimonas sp. TaxID=1871086 RepID=UPI002DF03BBA|nr:hypothetical protein [Brevundimonas sp.]
MQTDAGSRTMLQARALEIWQVIQGYDAPYAWSVGPKARAKLEDILGRPVACWQASTPADVNRSLRTLMRDVLNDPATDAVTAGRLYGWIVADWGGVRRNRSEVETWAAPSFGWHAGYDDAVLLAYADRVGVKRISSWSKVFAFAAPDRHAIYDSRVAVALNLALEQLGETERFFMPPSRVVRGKDGAYRPNAVARARARMKGEGRLGYRDYLSWLESVRFADGQDFLTIEATLFAVAPEMASGTTEAAVRAGDG